MRVLQINNFESIGGGSDRVYQLTTRMLLDRGHFVATLSCGEESFDMRKTTVLLPRNDYFNTSPFQTLRNIRDFIYRPEAVNAIEDLVDSFRPDIAHLHIFYGQLSSSVIAVLRRLKIPCVMTVHEYRLLCPISTLYNERLGICERCAQGEKHNLVVHRCNRKSILASALSFGEAWTRDRYFNYLEHISHFFMVSKFCLEKHSEYLPDISQKASVLYNFVPEGDIAETPGIISHDAPFLYVGRLSYEKGVILLCSAVKERPNLRLRIAGDGPIADSIKAEFSIYPNIEFLGRLPPSVIKEELRKAKFSIVPSDWYENNPMSVLESFGVGTPVIGSEIGGIPELVLPGSTGILFNPSDKRSLLRALDNAYAMPLESRNSLGSAALAMIRLRHNESIYYNQLIDSYEKVIRKSNGSN